MSLRTGYPSPILILHHHKYVAFHQFFYGRVGNRTPFNGIPSYVIAVDTFYFCLSVVSRPNIPTPANIRLVNAPILLLPFHEIISFPCFLFFFQAGRSYDTLRPDKNIPMPIAVIGKSFVHHISSSITRCFTTALFFPEASLPIFSFHLITLLL